MLEAFPWEQRPCRTYFAIGIALRSGLSAARAAHGERRSPDRPTGSPWQNPFVERLIGSIRRECLDRVVISMSGISGASSGQLRCLLPLLENPSFAGHGLSRAAPFVEPPGAGAVIAVPEVGGLHHHYARRAA